MIEAPGKKALLALLLFVVGITIVFVGVNVGAGGQAEISLEDVRKNPENYLEIEVNGVIDLSAGRTLCAEFSIVNITPRPDPYNRLRETYYLVYINDTFGYEVAFVISEDDLPKYEEYVGETVPFRLEMSIGHEMMIPPDTLITNILATKEDSLLGVIYYVYVYLVVEIPSLSFRVPWTIGTIAVTTLVLAVITFKRKQKKEETSPSTTSARMKC